MFAVETFGDLAFGDIFLHLLMGNLALLADEFALEDFCRSLFDGFLLTASPRCLPSTCLHCQGCGPGGRGGGTAGGVGGGGVWPSWAGAALGHCSAAMASSRKESVQRHVLRLLIHLHHRVAPSKLEALRKALEPTGQVGAPALGLCWPDPLLVCMCPAWTCPE